MAIDLREQIRPLRIAFMGYNNKQTYFFFRQFAVENSEQVAIRLPGQLLLKDGTQIDAVPPDSALLACLGVKYDQLIFADGARCLIDIHADHEIDGPIRTAMWFSCVPDEYKIQRYNVDADG